MNFLLIKFRLDIPNQRTPHSNHFGYMKCFLQPIHVVRRATAHIQRTVGHCLGVTIMQLLYHVYTLSLILICKDACVFFIFYVCCEASSADFSWGRWSPSCFPSHICCIPFHYLIASSYFPIHLVFCVDGLKISGQLLTVPFIIQCHCAT